MGDILKAAGTVGEPIDVVIDDKHVDQAQAIDALNPAIGAGTPATAPTVLPPARVGEPVRIAGHSTAVGTAVALAEAGASWPLAVAAAVVLSLGTELLRRFVTPSG